MLKGYLAVFTTGVFDGGAHGKFSLLDHDSRRALLATPIKELVTRFDVEAILIWTALLLKKRVLGEARARLQIFRTGPELAAWCLCSLWRQPAAAAPRDPQLSRPRVAPPELEYS